MKKRSVPLGDIDRGGPSRASVRSWQVPPDGLFDVVVPLLTTRQFIVVQLVCKEWSRASRSCLKDATPKRPDVDLGKIVKLYPNLTQLNLSHVEGLTTHMLAPLRQLTALRELCLSNILLQQHNGLDAMACDGQGNNAAKQLAETGRGEPDKHGQTGSRASNLLKPAAPAAATKVSATLLNPAKPATRGRANATAAAPFPATAATANDPGPSGTTRDGPAAAAAVDPNGACAPMETGDLDEEAASPLNLGPGGAGAGHGAGPSGTHRRAAAVGAAGAGAVADRDAPAGGPLARRLFGDLGEVLGRLTKLQADLCPALTAAAIASLPNLTDLTLDTVVSPQQLTSLHRLRTLYIRKLAEPDQLHALASLRTLLISSDSSCAADFLPVCAQLPELESLTFKTSSTKVDKQRPELSCWQGFSRLTSLDLRAPAEYLKPGLPFLGELQALTSLTLDLYCASEERLTARVVAPPNLQHLSVTSDRIRPSGSMEVHLNARLRSARLRLYWTALALVLPPEAALWAHEQQQQQQQQQQHTTGAAAGAAAGLRKPHTPSSSVRGGVAEGPHPRAGGRAGREEDAGLSPGRGAGACRWGAGRVGRGGGSAGAGSPEGSPAGGHGTAGAAGLRRSARHQGGVQGEGQQGKAGSDTCHGRVGAGAGRGAAGGSGSGSEEEGTEVGGPMAAAGEGAGEVKRRGQRRRRSSGACTGGGGEPGDGAGAGAAGEERRGGRGCTAAAAVAAATAAVQCSSGTVVDGPGPRAGAGSGVKGEGKGEAGGGSRGEGVGEAASAGGVCGGGMCLSSLVLDACFALRCEQLVPLLLQLPQLSELTLDNSLAMEDSELAALCRLTGLREVSLSGCHLLTDGGLRCLGRLRGLAGLRVKGLRKLSVHAAQAYMRQRPITRRHDGITCSFLSALSGLPSLRHLALKHLHSAREPELARGLRALTQLTRLEIKDVPAVSDGVLLGLTGHRRLGELGVLHCEGVTSRGRNAVVRSLGPRLGVDFEGCAGVPDLTRPCDLPTSSTQAQLIDDDRVSSSNRPRSSFQHSNQQ